MATRISRRQFWIIVGLGVALVAAALLSATVIDTKYSQRYYAEESDDPDAYAPIIPTEDLPPECQPIAERIIDGEEVSYTSHEVQLGITTRFVTRTTPPGGWKLTDDSCTEYEFLGIVLTNNGQFYSVSGVRKEDSFSRLHGGLLTLSIMAGSLLIFLGGIFGSRFDTSVLLPPDGLE